MSDTFEKLTKYAKSNDINFAIVDNPMEICPCLDLNGYDLINVETFEMPSAFEVQNAIIMCLKTPNVDLMGQMSYANDCSDYFNNVYNLRMIARPTYIAYEKEYVKLMCWCNLDMSDTYKKPTLEEVYRLLQRSI